MATISVYNEAGKKTGTMDLDDAVFGVKPRKSVIHQVFVAMMANVRQPWAHTKDRGEVRGGGKKPWKQKGTGRARHGSIRSPLWVGGGVTFGPRNVRNYSQKVNKKMKQQAMRMCLSDKVRSERLVVVEAFPSAGKTKDIATLRSALPLVGKGTALVTASLDDMVIRAAKNLPRTDVTRAQDLSVADCLNHQLLVVSKDAVAALTERLSK